MPILHTWLPDPILVTISGLTIHWYGLALALGAAAGYSLVVPFARRSGIALEHINTLFIYLVLGGLLGGRLYHVLNEWSYYTDHPNQILAIWNGGLGIHGAIMAGLAILWWYAKRHQLSFLALADVLVPGLALGQAIGRWGNYFNQELFGKPTALPWGIPIEAANRPASYRLYEYFHPTFLYESIGNLLILFLLIRFFRRPHHPGVVLATYVVTYSLLRIFTESLRIDRTPIIMGIRLPIIVSSVIILATITTVILLSRSKKSYAN